MANVSVTDLVIKRQAGTDNTYDATWSFTLPPSATAFEDADIKVGSRVHIISGAVYKNGVSVPNAYIGNNYTDTVKQIDSNNQNYVLLTGVYAWIDKKFLTVVGSSTTSGTSTTSSTLSKYSVLWQYYTGNGVWHNESWTDATQKVSSYTPPENSLRIQVYVKPVSKKHKDKNGKEVDYWTGTSAMAGLRLSNTFPSQIAMPNIEMLENNRILISNTGINDGRTDAVQYEIYNALNNKRIINETVTVNLGRCEFGYSAGPAKSLIVRARAMNRVDENYIADSDGWTDYSEVIKTGPTQPTNLKALTTSSDTVTLTWTPPKEYGEASIAVVGQPTMLLTDCSYELQYSTDFNDPSLTTSVSVAESKWVLHSLNPNRYFFRVRAIANGINSLFSSTVTATTGLKPDPPTIWSSSNSVMINEPITIFWQHNPLDGSRQQKVKIVYSYGDKQDGSGAESKTIIIDDTNKEDHNITTKYTFPTDESEVYISGSNPNTLYGSNKFLRFRVSTAGELENNSISGDDKYVYSNQSETGIVKVYAYPTIYTNIDHAYPTESGLAVRSFPIRVVANSGYMGDSWGDKSGWTQKPISYNIKLQSLTKYEAVNSFGEDVTISPKDNIFNKNINSSSYELSYDITPQLLNVSLVPGDYKLTCSVTMNSGLTATSNVVFTFDITPPQYLIDATAWYNKNNYKLWLRPSVWARAEDTGELVYPENVKISVFRRNYDGSFTQINNNPLSNPYSAGLTDPHPTLDVARYRIVATDNTTGDISYIDYSYEYTDVQHQSNIFAIIDWDEGDDTFRYLYASPNMAYIPEIANNDLRSYVIIKWNLDVTENTTVETKTIEYAGREDPVSYYGTHINRSSTWSFDIERTDTDTLARLRHLSKWLGPVYIREPSGIGYWANVKVNINQIHDSLLTKVKIDITKVEGGK